jgi:hypothetical protein
MGVLENQRLVLNRSWQAVNVMTVQAALSMMAADAATGMGFSAAGNFVPVKWSDWLNLPVRAGDDCIGTPSRRVRAPRVIIEKGSGRKGVSQQFLTMTHVSQSGSELRGWSDCSRGAGECSRSTQTKTSGVCTGDQAN